MQFSKFPKISGFLKLTKIFLLLAGSAWAFFWLIDLFWLALGHPEASLVETTTLVVLAILVGVPIALLKRLNNSKNKKPA